jgi:hypothetical protein
MFVCLEIPVSSFSSKEKKDTSMCQEFPSEASAFSVSKVHPTLPVNFCALEDFQWYCLCAKLFV